MMVSMVVFIPCWLRSRKWLGDWLDVVLDLFWAGWLSGSSLPQVVLGAIDNYFPCV